MSETTKAVNPPKDNKKRYSNRQGAKKSTANKNEQKSGTTVQRSNTSSTHVTSKKLFIDTNGMTNLQKWRENQETELGAKYGAMVASVFNSNYHKVILPKRCMKAERMLDEAEEVQRQIQIDAGVAPEDIQFEFDTYTLDEVLNEFSPENLNIDFYNMVGGLSEDELSEFQEHLDQLYQQELKVYRNRLQAVKSDSEKLFSDIVNSLSENSFNAVKDADGDWDTLRAEADPVKLMKLINETHYLDARQVKSQQRTKVRNAFYRDFRMRTNQQVSSFRKEFEWHQAMFEKVGLSMGEDDEIAEIFIDKLHEGYDGLRDEQERLEKNGVGNPLSNLKEAYQLALQFTPTCSPERTTGTVYNTETDDRPPNPKRGTDRFRNDQNKGKGNGKIAQDAGKANTSNAQNKNKEESNKSNTGGDGTPNKNISCYLCKRKHRIEDCPKLKDCQNYADSLYKDDEAVNHYLSSINCSLCNEVNSVNEKDEFEVFMDNCADASLFKNSQMLENIKECDGKIRDSS